MTVISRPKLSLGSVGDASKLDPFHFCFLQSTINCHEFVLTDFP
jgi:hypothetical protein